MIMVVNMKTKKYLFVAALLSLLTPIFFNKQVFAVNTTAIQITCAKTSLKIGEKTLCSIDSNSSTDGNVYTFVANINKTNVNIVNIYPANGWTKNGDDGINMRSTIGANGTYTVAQIEIEGAAIDSNGSIGLSAVRIATTAEGELINQSPTINTVSIRTMDNNASLSNLTTNHGTIEAFNADKLDYNIQNVDSSEVIINAPTVSSHADVDGDGKHTLRCGENNRFTTVTVTAEDGTTKAYTISAFRTCSADNTLKSIKPSYGSINFVPTTKTYEIPVPADMKTFSATGIANSGKATVTYSNNNPSITLKTGTNILLINVTSETGNTATYTLKVIRPAAPNDTRNTDSSLKNLTVSAGTLNFNKDVLEYTITVPFETEKVSITAEPNNSKATAEISDLKELVVGANIIKITVTAEDTTTTTYTLTINRQENGAVKLDNDSTLSGIVINDQYYIFDTKSTNLNVKINNFINKANIVAFPNKQTSTASIRFEGDEIGDKDTVKIVVTAEDQSTTTYLINFSFPYSERTIEVIETKPINYILIIVIALIALAIVGFLIYKILTFRKEPTSNKPGNPNNTSQSNAPTNNIASKKSPQTYGRWYNN